MNTPEFEILGLAILESHLMPDFLSIKDDIFQDQFIIECRNAMKELDRSESDINEYSILTWIVDKTEYSQEQVAENLGYAMDTLAGSGTYSTVKKHLYQIDNKKKLHKIITDAALKIERNEQITGVLDFLIAESINMATRTGQKRSLVSIKDASAQLFEKMERISNGKHKRTFTGTRNPCNAC